MAELKEFSEKITLLLEQITKAQISNSNTLVNSICKNTVINFKKDNIRNFLNSVENAIEETGDDPEKTKKVLKYAQARVDSDAVISAKTYEKFEDFKIDILRQFKATKTCEHIQQELMMLQQKDDETVQKYGKRATELNSAWIEALYAEKGLKNENVEPTRHGEMEARVINHFISGLKRWVKAEFRGVPVTLPKAISIAGVAEASAHMQRVASQMNEDKKKPKPKPFVKNVGEKPKMIFQNRKPNPNFDKKPMSRQLLTKEQSVDAQEGNCLASRERERR
jgi:hypothetical protein